MTNKREELTIIVCDDRPEKREVLVDLIKSASDINPTPLVDQELKAALDDLHERAQDIVALKDNPKSSRFDDADLVFIDYRLEKLTGVGPFTLTSENVIGNIRAFAGTNYIVSLNLFDDVDFDLKDLFGARESAADLAISEDHIKENGLWGKGAGRDGFRPSYWPNLFHAQMRRKDQVKDLSSKLDKRVLEYLGFDERRRARLPVDALSSLFPRGIDHPIKATFWDLFETAAEDISPEFIKIILERHDSAADESSFDFEIVARVCAAKVERWLRLHILAPQDVLVDLPHLVDRAPQILSEDQLGNLTAWNAAVDATDVSNLADDFDTVVGGKIFEQWELWFDRPAFWWIDLAELDDIVWPEFGEGVELPDFVFCEDTSKFEDGNGQTAFQIHQVSAYRSRFIKRLEGRSYAPTTQLAAEGT